MKNQQNRKKENGAVPEQVPISRNFILPELPGDVSDRHLLRGLFKESRDGVRHLRVLRAFDQVAGAIVSKPRRVLPGR